MKKSTFINALIILGVILLALLVLGVKGNNGNVNETTAKCIGNNSILFVQKGCRHCETQLKMFGTSKDNLNIVDCYYEKDKCITNQIEYTPTWLINGEYYTGTQDIETLTNLTGCNNG